MKILFVCSANVCRSPLAEGYLKMLLQKGDTTDVLVSSAGISALVDSPPFTCAIEVAKMFHFDISTKRSLQLTPTMVQEADRILCMETWQASAVMQMDPSGIGKVGLLGAFHPVGKPLLQIPDPERFTTPHMMSVFHLIQASVDHLYQRIRAEKNRL